MGQAPPEAPQEAEMRVLPPCIRASPWLNPRGSPWPTVYEGATLVYCTRPFPGSLQLYSLLPLLAKQKLPPQARQTPHFPSVALHLHTCWSCVLECPAPPGPMLRSIHSSRSRLVLTWSVEPPLTPLLRADIVGFFLSAGFTPSLGHPCGYVSVCPPQYCGLLYGGPPKFFFCSLPLCARVLKRVSAQEIGAEMPFFLDL